MYIQNGPAVNASWANHIAVSKNGTDWETISKTDITVNNRIVNGNLDSPLVTREKQLLITLNGANDSRQLLRFDVLDVQDQPTWLAPATDDAKLREAVKDITAWLG